MGRSKELVNETDKAFKGRLRMFEDSSTILNIRKDGSLEHMDTVKHPETQPCEAQSLSKSNDLIISSMNHS